MRFASHRCGQASMVVQNWYVGDQRHVVFEASGDHEAGAELHFNYFLHERNIAAKEKLFCSRDTSACGATECEGSIANDFESLADDVAVEDSSASRDFMIAGSPSVEVIVQMGQQAWESVCAIDIAGCALQPPTGHGRP